MARIHIILPEDLKKDFQVKTIEIGKDMTEVLLGFIKSFVKSEKQRKAA